MVIRQWSLMEWHLCNSLKSLLKALANFRRICQRKSSLPAQKLQESMFCLTYTERNRRRKGQLLFKTIIAIWRSSLSCNKEKDFLQSSLLHSGRMQKANYKLDKNHFMSKVDRMSTKSMTQQLKECCNCKVITKRQTSECYFILNTIA